MYQYDPDFYRYINKGAIASAQRVVESLTRHLPVRSVADFGCGQGAWLSVWKERHKATVTGLDGDYVDRNGLLIAADEFTPVDLTRPLDLGRRFDLAQCLEVAEHLPQSAAATLVHTLTRHAPMVMFSAAPPGQGGENHVNEQPYAFWRDLFAQEGFLAFDPIRPAVAGMAEVEPWYRYNILLFVHRDQVAGLPAEVSRHRIPDHAPVPDVSPLPYRIRKWFISLLPVSVMTGLATLKKHLSIASRREAPGGGSAG
ncbi:MAG: methyltransferase domain-containing protein [Nitrospirota bacterium]|nr:methyltransferase domain-containing protein [Nitrospirota bacterium]